MSNSESLKGKEFIDFILDYLTGKTHKPEPKPGFRVPKNCANQLNTDEAKKLVNILKDSTELSYYFNAKDGFKTLVDSLHFSYDAFTVLEALLPENEKLREDFQRQHLYEALIDFLYRRNIKSDGPTLPNEHVYSILVLLENASLSEVVRSTLSEMTKIKDLFLIVIRSIEVLENMKLVSSLIQFISNLCYGTGKFRKMLAMEPPVEFLTTIENILEMTSKTQLTLEDKSKIDWDFESKRSLLKGATLGFVGNLCVEVKLRQVIAADMGGVLSRVYVMLQSDVNSKPFDWVEGVTKELAVLINCSLEDKAVKFIAEKDIVQLCESVLKQTKISEKGHLELMGRCLNVLAKVGKVESAQEQITNSKTIIITSLLYYGSDNEDLAKQSLLTLHCCFRKDKFKEICLETHKFSASAFDSFVKQSI